MAVTRTRRVLLVALFGFGCVGIGSLAGYYLLPMRGDSPSTTLNARTAEFIGHRLPNLPVRTTDGVLLDRWPDNHKSTLLLVFRAGCGICSVVAPTWANLVAKMPGGSVTYAISVDRPRIGDRWLQKEGMLTVSHFTPENIEGLNTTWNVIGTPLTMLLDNAGTVIFAKYGMLNTADLTGILRVADAAVRSTE